MLRPIHIRIVFLSVLLALSACTGGGAPPLPVDVNRALEQGRDAANAWIGAGRGAASERLDGEGVVALGYLERLRLGLGGPFRLAAYALSDPRLADSTRARVAWAILARTLDGDAYALDPALVTGVPGGAAHLRLVEDVVEGAPDPRAGDLAVRIGYALAAAEGSVSPATEWVMVRAAALVRDRALARADARRLLGTEERVLEAIPVWRAERRFAVERPALETAPAEAQRLAVRLAPRIAEGIRTARAGEAVPRRPLAVLVPGPLLAAGDPGGARPLLGPHAAARLARAAERLGAPPESPVVIAVDRFVDHLREQAASSDPTGWDRLARARTSEHLVAENAALRPHSAIAAGLLARAMLDAATGLRVFAQEEPWFPGMAGPAADELAGLFGVASVRFDADVPEAWRPYYTRLVLGAITDLQRVVPTAQFRGLRIHFTGARLEGGTLAKHDPSPRTLVLPAGTAAGTLAHELAHDLDWQAALRLYGVRGGYASDRAFQRGSAARMELFRAVSPDSLHAPARGGNGRAMHASRPAEAFARAMDWFVAASLAREGRMNGALSSVQDDVLKGYGSMRPPDISGRSGTALMTLLDDVAPVPAEVRRRFLDRYGSGRALLPYDVVRGIVAAAPPTDAVSPPTVDAVVKTAAAAGDRLRSPRRALEGARATALANIDAWSCRAVGVAHDFELESALRGLVHDAVAARTRGLLREWGRVSAGETGRAWVDARLAGVRSVEPPDSALAAGVERSLAMLQEPQTSAPTIIAPAPLLGAHCTAGWFSPG